MRRFRGIWAVLSVLLAATAPLSAQVANVASGARIRVVAPERGPRAIVGIYDTASSEWIAFRRVRADSVERIPWPLVARLEVSAGRNTRRGRLRGALIGFGASVAGGFLCLAICPTSTEDGANLAPVGGFLYGLFIGAPVGALVGGRYLAPERWRAIPVSAGRVPPAR